MLTHLWLLNILFFLSEQPMKNRTHSPTPKQQLPNSFLTRSFFSKPLFSELKWLDKSAPIIGGGLVGVGMALGHIATTSNCTLPQQGRCSTCGSCVIALGTLVAWAVLKKSKDSDLYQKR